MRDQYRAGMDEEAIGAHARQVLRSLLAHRRDGILVENLCIGMQDQRDATEELIGWMEGEGWATCFWEPKQVRSSEGRGRYVQLTVQGVESARRMLAAAPQGPDGVVRVFLWQGWDAALLAWKVRDRRGPVPRRMWGAWRDRRAWERERRHSARVQPDSSMEWGLTARPRMGSVAWFAAKVAMRRDRRRSTAD